MNLGVLSDTHDDRMNALPYIIAAFKKSGVQTIIHCGDIDPKHLNPALYGNMPVVCALTDEQAATHSPDYNEPPPGWIFTLPDNRIVDLDSVRVYVGHKRSFEILYGSEVALLETMHKIRRDHDRVRYIFSGHTHHQIFMQNPLINFINPGAIEDPMGILGGYEYTVINTETNEIIFSRIPATKGIKRFLNVGVISDSRDIAETDTEFWKKLAAEFDRQQVTHIIHCGNIASADIGRKEFEEFQVHYNLLLNQQDPGGPENWHCIPYADPVIDIEGYYFFVQYNLGASLLDKSEMDLHRLSLLVQKEHPEVKFLLFGFSHNGFYEEGQQMVILNPGDIVKDRNYAVIRLPSNEIVFNQIPVEPLPRLAECSSSL
jgi:predicted phosphodiesterase